MPELPEVETVVVTLRPKAVGKVIAEVIIYRQDIITPIDTDLPTLLRSKSIQSIDRRGKRIIFTLTDGNRFYIHLGMTGRLVSEATDVPLKKHTHLILRLSGAPEELRFIDPRRFGGVWWLGSNVLADERMGPEPLKLSNKALSELLSKTKRAIKVALLDQTLIAGLGNIYVDEALHAARIHPLTPANSLNDVQIALLNKSIKRVLGKAIRSRGSSLRDYVDADGNRGGFQKLHRVYDRMGERCRSCKRESIARITLGGRSTHYCPACQRASVIDGPISRNAIQRREGAKVKRKNAKGKQN